MASGIPLVPFAAVPSFAQHKALFFGSAGCSGCHMVAGEGGFIANDLSAYASGHSVREIKDAMTHTGRNWEVASRHVVMVTRDGERYDGIVRNEDNFSIQLQTLDGTFQFFMKKDVSEVLHQPPVVPPGNAVAVTSAESDDVAKFLVSAAKTSNNETDSDTE